MIVIKKEGDSIKEVKYPANDIKKPIVGLEKDIQYYWINETERPSFNPNKSRLSDEFVLTDDIHPEYKHLLVCNKIWKIIDFDAQIVIKKLNDSLGNHLDTEYLTQTRIKHSDELNGVYGEVTQERIDYLMELKQWQKRCIDERDKRELDFLNNNIFPDFIWEPKPIKT